MSSKHRIGKGLIRGVGLGAGLLLWAVALAPMAALLPATVLDRGPGGSARPTLFPAALAALDPFVWDCLRNSVLMAAAVTAVAAVAGLGLARAAGRWGHRPLAALGVAATAVSPAFAAIGLRWWSADLSGRWPALGPWVGWLAWFWVALGQGVPLVALAAGSALRRVEPSWADAAKLAGVTRSRAWRRLIWPTVRPDVARALGVVFTLTLIEPGAPIVLGLRRTLGFQIVVAALDRDQIGRAAVLALLATALAGLVRLLLRRWGGPLSPEPVETPKPRIERTSWPRRAATLLLVGTAALVMWLPVVGLAAIAMGTGQGGEPAPGRVSFSTFRAMAHDPLMTRYLLNSAALGFAVLTVALVLARVLTSLASRGRAFAALASLPDAFPPLAIGVGALSLPWVLGMGADGLASVTRGRSPVVVGLRAAVDLLDLDRTPGVLLVLAVATSRLPLPARSSLGHRRRLRPVLLDAALCLGAAPSRARRTMSGRWLGVSSSAAVLTFTLAATSVTPALILCPTADVRSLGPAVLSLASEPGGWERAAALATVAIGVNLAALGLTSRDRAACA